MIYGVRTPIEPPKTVKHASLKIGVFGPIIFDELCNTRVRNKTNCCVLAAKLKNSISLMQCIANAFSLIQRSIEFKEKSEHLEFSCCCYLSHIH